MARLIGFLAVVILAVLLVVLVMGVLVVLKLLSGIVWLALFAPLVAFAAGFLLALIAGVSNIVTSDNVKSFALFAWGAVGGIGFVKVGDWRKDVTDFFKNPEQDPLVFITATASFFLLVGAAAGLVVGLKIKPAVQTNIAQGQARRVALFAAYRGLLFPT